jgi:predicted dehydrogenase
VERHTNTALDLYPGVRIYKSCEELFEDPAVELVVVNTPNPTHSHYAHKALLAGKHVIVDKPFAATSGEGQSLIELAKKQGRIISVYHNRRMEGELLAVKEIVNSGILGRLVEAEFRFERFRPELNTKRHKEENAPANGIIYELGTHLIDQALFVFGRPSKVVYIDRCKMRDFSHIDDYCLLILHYNNGFRVLLRCSLLAAEQAPAYVLHGTDGSFTKYRANIQENQLVAGMKPDDPAFGAESEETYGKLTLSTSSGELTTRLYPSPQASYIDYYRQFAKAIRGEAPLPVDPYDAVEGLRIIEASFR